MSSSQQLILGEGAGGAVAANYIEDVFSTYLYTGNGSTQTITNGIDLSTKGGLVWIKSRSAGYGHYIFDTNRGALNRLASNGTGAESSISNSLTSFLSNGFSLGSEIGVNESPGNYASWTFRKQPKFFDVVTYTGTGSLRTVAHSLGSVPGTIIVKCTSEARSWFVYHRSLGENKYLTLETTNAEATDAGSGGVWGGTAPTATEFTVGATAQTNGGSGRTYVAYLFAHNAGGFGLTGTDNVISCGSFTTDGSGNATVSLGYEPQWVLYKRTDAAGDWRIVDVMRGYSLTSTQLLEPNKSGAEYQGFDSTYQFFPTATGFQSVAGFSGVPNSTFIYIAIRRGPMKTPTTGTSVFSPTTASSEPQSTPLLTGGSFPSDMVLHRPRYTLTSYGFYNTGRLTGGGTSTLETFSTVAAYDFGSPPYWKFDNSTAAYIPANGYFNNNGEGNIGYALYSFRRAPGFFDVVCYTGDGTDPRSITHNLTATPELMIVKRRDAAANWRVYSAATGATNQLFLNLTDASAASAGAWSNTAPTSSAFTVGFLNNGSGATFVAYLFATVSGVSKVGSYTGTGTTKQIDCGFTGGARFVLIKRTDSTGDWYVWDSARGIVAGNDPYLLLNSTAAEITNTDYVDTYSAGFEISSTAPAAINANGGSFIFLAIA